MSKKPPEKVFRVGFVPATVFVNETDLDGGKRTFRSVNVQRSYPFNMQDSLLSILDG